MRPFCSLQWIICQSIRSAFVVAALRGVQPTVSAARPRRLARGGYARKNPARRGGDTPGSSPAPQPRLLERVLGRQQAQVVGQLVGVARQQHAVVVGHVVGLAAVDVVADVRRAVVRQRVVELRLGRPACSPAASRRRTAPGPARAWPWCGRRRRRTASAIEFFAGSRRARRPRTYISSYCWKKPFDGAVRLALLLADLDRHGQIVAVVEAEAEHRVGDARRVVERHDDEIDRRRACSRSNVLS